MVRPRKYIHINGKMINGIHLHKATGRYYITDRRSRQVYFLRRLPDESVTV